MRFIILFASYLLLLSSAFAQEDFLAKRYFEDGDFEKAVVFYEKLIDKNPRRTDYAESLISCYQQLERYGDAKKFLLDAISLDKVSPTFFIELGYNYTLQDSLQKANSYYDQAISKIIESPSYGYAIGFRFQKYALLDYALKAYDKTMQLNSKVDYNFQMARIYGEQGNIKKMFTSYLTLIRKGKYSTSKVIRNIDDFISEDGTAENNIMLKTLLLKNAQKDPDLIWNQLLSWLFVQQKQYGSAFRQEKAINKRRDGAAIQRLENLGDLVLEENDTETAQSIYKYVIANAFEETTRLDAELKIIEIQLITADDKQLNVVQEKFSKLLEIHGYKSQTLQLQVAYANFLTFKKDLPKPAIKILKNCLEIPINTRGTAFIKMALADILVFDKKFNEALIYYSQTQKKLKNDVLGQNARYKVAQTSFYKGDFDWALTQLKVLRNSTSQLIANDAMQLSLLISDNSLEDSTQTALKKYARADLLAYQNKTKEAIDELNGILLDHKGDKIEDEALLKQAKLLEDEKDYAAAELNYRKIIEFYGGGILADDAYYKLGEIYRNVLNQPEKAKAQYEKIIYNYQDSYYFPQARKHFRRLRGDAIN